MRCDILLAGVGGQGVLSMAAVIGRAALAEGLFVKQSEVHGMAQRGGAVQAHLRLSDRPIESDLIAKGTAHLILSLEPVESLRYLDSLAPTGSLITASNPFRNIGDYPPLEAVLAKIRALPRAVVVDAEAVANAAGEIQTVNTAMVGAAAPRLPVRMGALEAAVRETFRRKGDAVVASNLAALYGGEAAAIAAQADPPAPRPRRSALPASEATAPLNPAPKPTPPAPPPGPRIHRGDPSMTPRLDVAAARNVLVQARRAGVRHLLESDAKAVLDKIGIATPTRILLSGPAGAEGLPDPPLSSGRLVLKALTPGLLHKTEAGAVRIVPAHKAAVISEIRAMERRLDGHPIEGFLLEEYVGDAIRPAHELLLGLRWTPDFGPVVMVGAGGVHAEALAGATREGEALAVFTPAATRPESIGPALARVAAVRLATSPQRGRPPALPLEALVDAVRRFLALAEAVVPELLLELEVNPLVVAGGRLVALDGLARAVPADEITPSPAPARPIEKIGRLLEPRSIALVGVSEKSMNPGRVILGNVLKAGFPHDRVVVVKPGAVAIDGVRCVPSLDSLPETGAFHGTERRADLVVLSLPAADSPELVEAIASDRRGESVILIPGGLEEHPESGPAVARMREAIEGSRAEDWRGPVLNGGNCLGIRSAPGRYDTFFTPEEKLPHTKRPSDPVALISGSGAFAVSKASKLPSVNPLYTISIGNQTDLTVSDYLEYLKEDRRLDVFAVYLEGFRLLDGARFLAVAGEIAASGRTVILYRGGRSAAGQAAASSHTAAIAGDYVVTRALATEAGVIVADTLEEFEDLIRLATALRFRSVESLDLGAVSNAGYESVAIADNLGPFRLASFAPATTAALRGALERAGLGAIAPVRNPLDVTPILDDGGYEDVVRAILDDPGVAVGVVGCVPMTGALHTLPRGEGRPWDLGDPDALVPSLLRIAGDCRKAWVAVVDAGPLYDPMARALEDGGVPTFRAADRAMRAFARYCEARLRRKGRAEEPAVLAEPVHPAPFEPEPIPKAPAAKPAGPKTEAPELEPLWS